VSRDYDNLVQRVKEAVSLREFVERSGVSLDKKGMGLCPFHADKNPSMHVTDDFFKCFACGAGGDVFTWLDKKDGLPFKEALNELATRYRIPMPHWSDEQKQAAASESRRRDVLTALANYWHEAVGATLAGQAGRSPLRDWLVHRWGDVVDSDKIGFAKDGPNFRRFIEKLAGEKELHDLGILGDGKLSGLLSDRITVPDWRGGRVNFMWTRAAPHLDRKGAPPSPSGEGGVPHLDQQDKVGGQDKRPKYLPYARVEHHPLGGAPLINAAALIGAREIWLTEGVSKVLTMKRLGYKNVVGLAGVSNLGDHFDDFAHVDRIWILLDTDAAGTEWAWKYARRFGARARVVELQKLKSPDSADYTDKKP